MMASRLSVPHRIAARSLSAQAAAKQSGHEGHGRMPPPRLQQTKLPNGAVIAAVENYSPVSRIGVFVRAGSRFERPDQLGLVHALRNAAGLATRSSSHFGITRHIEYSGGSLTAASNREDIVYILENTRDSIGENISFLADTVTRPAFRPWEVNDNNFRLGIDLARLHGDPNAQLLEAVHKAAFRAGLANPLYSPSHKVGKYGHNCLANFVAENFFASRTAIVGVGIELSALVAAVEKHFELNTTSASAIAPSKFVGGEVRIDAGNPLTVAAVVGEGAAAKNQKEVLALALVQQLLGTTPRVAYSTNNGALGTAAAKASQSPVAVSALNISYSDTGLFGFVASAKPEDIGNVIKASIGQLRTSAKGFNDSALQKAKTILKAQTLISLENGGVLLDELGSQALNYQKVFTPDEICAAIDSVTAQDVSTALNRALKGKVAIASVGQVGNVPSLEELQAN